MNKIKIFKSSSKDFLNIEEYINAWAEEEGKMILQHSVVSGASYTSFGNRQDDKEIFVSVLYSEINQNINNK
jgi:hypothetical protein